MIVDWFLQQLEMGIMFGDVVLLQTFRFNKFTFNFIWRFYLECFPGSTLSMKCCVPAPEMRSECSVSVSSTISR